MSYGFLCCGPGTLHTVVDSDDGEDSEPEAEVVRSPGNSKGGSQREALGDDAPIGYPPTMVERINGAWQSMFAPTHGRRRASSSMGMYPPERRLHFLGHRTGSDPSILNLAFRETHRLPDVAGEEKVAWAAGISRIDLTETGIRTLRGLDAFPHVQTLVLDGNGLLSLPDCPWVPTVETLWMCNNEVDNLDRLLEQVADSFPRLTALALMGNPVWPAARSRVNETMGEVRRRTAQASRRGQEFSSTEAVGNPDLAGGHMPSPPPGAYDEDSEERIYRMQILRRLHTLRTLDCTDVTDEERDRARAESRDMDDLLLEQEPSTDVEESLPSTGPAESVSHGVSKLLEDERARRSKLPDRSSLPSTWIKEAIVMDVGSSWTKMGLAGQEKPTCRFPTVVGRIDLRGYDRRSGQDEKIYVGDKAIEEANKRIAERDQLLRKWGLLDDDSSSSSPENLPSGTGPVPRPILLNRPMTGGVITDWDDIEEIWRHGIEGLMGLDPLEHPVLMADSTATPSGAREKATEILFETMTTPAIHMALQPVLALFACGPSSGLVVDVGDSGTQIAPIYDGYLLEKGVRYLKLGGNDVTRQLAALVNAKVGLQGGEEFDPNDPRDVMKLEALKANMCFVSENVDKDNARMELSMTKPYVLPDGTRVTLGRERYRSSEMLFDPLIALRQEPSLQGAILNSILACERNTWPVLAHTVILTGGTTELPGLNRRLQRELTKARRAHGIKLKFTVMVPEDDHNNTVWLGGSMLASTGQLDGLWFTRAEYEEYGAAPIHAKFEA